METVTVSTKYQIVIPRKVREKMGVKVGQKITVLAYDDRIVLIPLRPVQESRGSLKGIDTRVERDEEDRL